MNSFAIRFDLTPEEALTKLEGKPEQAFVFSFYNEQDAAESIVRRLEHGWEAMPCTVTKNDADGNPLSLPSFVCLKKAS